MATLDHLVVGAAALAAGADHVERLLGVRPAGGGRHEGAGTYNLLLGLGRDAYLEVIARDPDAPEPAHPRLLGLDDADLRQKLEARPALLTWVARTPALDPLVARLGPQRAGAIRPMSRGNLSWRLATPPPHQDFSGLLPGLIEWGGKGAAGRMPDSGCRLVGLEGEHPEVDALRAALRERGLDDAIALRHSPRPRLLARIRKPNGDLVVLSSD